VLPDVVDPPPNKLGPLPVLADVFPKLKPAPAGFAAPPNNEDGLLASEDGVCDPNKLGVFPVL